MERYTAPTYNEALKLAEASIRGKFDVVNSREIDLSSSGISDEKLIEITVETKKNLSPTINSEMSKLNSFEINLAVNIAKKYKNIAKYIQTIIFSGDNDV